MIGRLRGTLISKQPPTLVIDVGGVGYELEAPMSTYYTLPAVGEPITLLTHLAVRDDAHQLFGFASEAERRLFRDLIKVTGVGARLALMVLSGISVNDFIATVQQGDDKRLTRLPGVGKKTAARLVVEMRDRIGLPSRTDAAFTAPPIADADPDPETEAFSALVALGYRPAEATRLLRKVASAGLNSEELIRLALQAAVNK